MYNIVLFYFITVGITLSTLDKWLLVNNIHYIRRRRTRMCYLRTLVVVQSYDIDKTRLRGLSRTRSTLILEYLL